MLAVGSGKRDHGGVKMRILRGEGDGRTDLYAEAICLLLRDRDLWLGLIGLPPFAFGNFSAGWRGVRPGKADGAQQATREGVELRLRGGDAVDRLDARVDDRDQFGFAGDAGLCLEHLADAVDLGIGDIDQEHIRQVWRGGDVEFGDDGALDKVDRHDLHNPHAQRGEQGCGWVPGTIEVGEAVPQRRGKVQSRAIEEELDAGKHDC